MIDDLELKPEEYEGRQFYFGAGCDECNQTGYSGRSGLFEMIRITDAYRELITAGAATIVLARAAHGGPPGSLAGVAGPGRRPARNTAVAPAPGCRSRRAEILRGCG